MPVGAHPGGLAAAGGDHLGADEVQISRVDAGGGSLSVGHAREELAGAVILEQTHERVVPPRHLLPGDEIDERQKTQAVR